MSTYSIAQLAAAKAVCDARDLRDANSALCRSMGADELIRLKSFWALGKVFEEASAHFTALMPHQLTNCRTGKVMCTGTVDECEAVSATLNHKRTLYMLTTTATAWEVANRHNKYAKAS